MLATTRNKSLSIDFKFTLDNYRELFCMKKIQGLAIIEILSRVSLTSTTDFIRLRAYTVVFV